MDSKLINAYEQVIEDLYADGGNPDVIRTAVLLLEKRKAELKGETLWHS